MTLSPGGDDCTYTRDLPTESMDNDPELPILLQMPIRKKIGNINYIAFKNINSSPPLPSAIKVLEWWNSSSVEKFNIKCVGGG